MRKISGFIAALVLVLSVTFVGCEKKEAPKAQPTVAPAATPVPAPTPAPTAPAKKKPAEASKVYKK